MDVPLYLSSPVLPGRGIIRIRKSPVSEYDEIHRRDDGEQSIKDWIFAVLGSDLPEANGDVND